MEPTNSFVLKRRQFLKSTAAGIALLGLPEIARPAATSPEVDLSGISLGVIGLGPRGLFLLERFQKHCPVRALCDVHQGRLESAAAKCSGPGLQFGDYRKLLASDSISGVVIATPDHWHAGMTLDAIRAGKHVFCETPACRTLGEARSLLELKNPGNLKIQVGAQGRANSAAFAACRYLREGQAGKIHTVRLWSAPDEPFKPSTEHSDTPPGLDWPFWERKIVETYPFPSPADLLWWTAFRTGKAGESALPFVSPDFASGEGRSNDDFL